ncbi:hypothetical protein L249_4235, partial [Ophiocordyceps polyrhachis-furcata BCC 54312]
RRAGRSRPEAAVRHRGCTSQRLRRLRHGYAVQRLRPYGPYGPRRLRHGYAVQRLRPYGPYGPYEGRNVG